jgi:tetratricopeptide (TPR) repeat protein
VSPMLLINYARVLRDLGRMDEAADYAERAYTKAKMADDQVVVNQALLERARIYLAQGDAARSEAMLAEVEPRLRRNLPPGHVAFAALPAEHALIAQARGDAQTALQLTDRSMAMLEASVKAGGQGSESLPFLLVRRSGLELRLQRPDEAVADATRAVEMLHDTTPTGTLTSNLGRAYLALGRALEVQGKQDEAHATIRSALSHLESALGSGHPDTQTARELAESIARGQ